jgi:Flp pilus assembly protein TadD
MSSSTPDPAAFALFRAGKLPEAEAAFRAIVQREPRNASALHLLGFILATTGRRDEGLALLDRAVEIAPKDPALLDNRGQVLLQAGRVEAACTDFLRAAEAAPKMGQAWLHLSQALRRLGHRDDARKAIAKAVAIDGKSAPIRYHEGLLALDAGDYPVAEKSFRAAIAADPHHVQAINNLGVVLRQTGRAEEALASFQRAAARDPNSPEALNNLGFALHQSGREQDAIRLFKRAVQLRPSFPQALLNWGTVLRDRGDLAGAEERIAAALEAQADFPEALVNGGSLALECEQLEKARARYERAARLRPDAAEAQMGLAHVLLREQRFAEGWERYERRFDTDPPTTRMRDLDAPRLERESLADAKRVAVWMEQGVGDQVLFSTLLPELTAREIEVVAEVDPRLIAVYRRSLPEVKFVSPAESAQAFERCDFHTPAGSLPRLFRPDAASFAGQPLQLLKADPARVDAFRRELGDAPAIAIAWRSIHKGARRGLGERKSIPLEEFACLAESTGARLLDVQYGDVEAERRAFEERHPGVLVRLGGLDAFNDLEGLAAALVACGRVVSSSNATVHLAGALGVPTDLLFLRGWPPFSYWVPGSGARSLWYPSVRVPDAAWDSWAEAFEARGEGPGGP